MNFGIKCIVGLLTLGMAGLFVLKKPDGDPWLSVNDFLPREHSMQEITQSVHQTLQKTGSLEANSQDTDTKIYRWRDSQGHWQFSDKSPKNISSETMQLSGNLNRDLAESTQPPLPSTTSVTTRETSPTTTLVTTAPVDKVKQLMENTQKVKQLMEDRQNQLNQVQ